MEVHSRNSKDNTKQTVNQKLFECKLAFSLLNQIFGKKYVSIDRHHNSLGAEKIVVEQFSDNPFQLTDTTQQQLELFEKPSLNQ